MKLDDHDQKIQYVLDFIKILESKHLTTEEIHQFFRVMFTPKEIDAFSQRIQILKLLCAGTSQRDIAECLGVGIATITRGSRVLQENRALLSLLF